MLVKVINYDDKENKYIEKNITINKLQPLYYLTIVDIIEYPINKKDISTSLKTRRLYYLSIKDKTFLNRYLYSLGYIKDISTGVWYKEEKIKNKKRSK